MTGPKPIAANFQLSTYDSYSDPHNYPADSFLQSGSRLLLSFVPSAGFGAISWEARWMRKGPYIRNIKWTICKVTHHTLTDSPRTVHDTNVLET